MVTVDTSKLKRRLRARGMTVSGLAQAAGISRQAVYQMLRPDYRPVSPGVEAVARALEVDPLDLLSGENNSARRRRDVEDLLNRAGVGDARAFELLPAALLTLKQSELASLDVQDPTAHRLLAAAGEVAGTIASRPWLEGFVQVHASRIGREHAFCFGSSLIGIERLVSLTPEPMRRHGVFGAFDLQTFKRHCS